MIFTIKFSGKFYFTLKLITSELKTIFVRKMKMENYGK